MFVNAGCQYHVNTKSCLQVFEIQKQITTLLNGSLPDHYVQYIKLAQNSSETEGQP